MSASPLSPASSPWKYRAFISYSHRDTAAAEWLHRVLEGYRTPRALVGTPSRDGIVPQRLYPIFRDRDELPVSADLGANLKRSLEQSRYLIVICSPAAARSTWVEEEVRHYKAYHGEGRLLCLIVDGEPNAVARGMPPEQECFPRSVRFQLRADGSPGEVPVEPIAADLRASGDGRTRARLKLTAGLLGVNFDDLWQRERRRQRWRIAQGVLTALALVAVAAGLWQWSERRADVAAELRAGEERLRMGERRRAAVHLANAWRLGQRGSRIEAALQDAGKALNRPLREMGRSPDWITYASFQGEDEVLAAGWDKQVRRWSLASGTADVLCAEESKVWSAPMDRDGTRLAICTDTGAVQVRSAAGVLQRSLPHGGRRVSWAAFSPEGQRLVTAGDDGLARIWNLADLAAAPLPLERHDESVKIAHFSRDGAWVLTGSFDATAKLWDANTGQRLVTFLPHASRVNAAALSGDGRLVATGCLDGSVLLWTVPADFSQPLGAPRSLDDRHRERVNAVSFSPDGRRLLTASDDRTAKLWDVATGALLLSYETHDALVMAATFDDRGERVVTGGKDGILRIFGTQVRRRSAQEIVASADRGD